MSTEIYYFSGTGNSLVVAKDLAVKLDGKLTPIIPTIKKASITTDAQVIGLVFPIYDFKAPKLVDEFLAKIAALESKYVFAVATYGFLPQKSLKKLSTTIAAQGGKLSAGFIVEMPNNGLSYQVSSEKQKKLFTDWQAKLENISSYVANREEGKIETTNMFAHLILSGLFIKVIPQVLPLLKQVLLKGWDSFAFTSDENCDGCGLCVKVCPMENAVLVDKKPFWSDNCALCFACLQWCPNEAIQAGEITKNRKRYHHPAVKVSEIIKQKQTITQNTQTKKV